MHTYHIIYYTFDQPGYVSLKIFEMVRSEVYLVVIYLGTVRYSFFSIPCLIVSNIVFDFFFTITEVEDGIFTDCKSKNSSIG